MSAITVRRPRQQLTPHQRLEAARRIKQVREGHVRIPLACPKCFSSSLEESDTTEPGLRCLACGTVSKHKLVHTIRKQRLRRFLLDGKGVDHR